MGSVLQIYLLYGRLTSPPPPSVSPSLHELPGQLTFATTSTKKRKISRATLPDQDVASTPSSPSEILAPSCELDDDPTLSFSVTSNASSSFASLPPRDVPGPTPRLQTHFLPSFLSADDPSSAASTPCAAYADLSIEPDRPAEVSVPETGSSLPLPRSRSPLKSTRRTIMSADGEHHRSSSPLKRLASSMDSEPETSPERDRAADVEMANRDPSPQAKVAASDRELPRDMSVDIPERNPVPSQDSVPLLENQITTIQGLLKTFNEEPVLEGSECYLITRTWVTRALALGGDAKASKDVASETPLGPVDNSDIILETIDLPSGEAFVRLRPGLDQGDFELFPPSAWELIVAWYGLAQGQRAIKRWAINIQQGPTELPNIIFEIHPPVLTVHRVWSEVSGVTIPEPLKNDHPPPVRFVRSATSSYHEFLKDVKAALGIPLSRKIRLWEMDRTERPADSGAVSSSVPSTTLTPPDSPDANGNAPDAWSGLLIDVPTFVAVPKSERHVVTGDDQTANPKYNGRATLALHALTSDKILVAEENNGSSWVSVSVNRNVDKRGAAVSSTLQPQSRPVSGRTSPVSTGPMTRGRSKQKRNQRGVGAAGLVNLGNTCYMNSALQCVRSVEELSKYFLTNEYAKEINRENRLGWDGKMAIAYGHLLKEMYSTDVVRPVAFKNTVGHCRPTFAGWSQQDSQEFLGFLLDALQEDLSRVKKKPYIEKPDSTDEMVGDDEAIAQMAEQVWQITKRRDDSVIADLFTGLYKSTLKCPVCQKISITFDPFNNLTLPLPVENLWSSTIRFFPLNDTPVDIEVELPKHSAVEALKEYISLRTGVPANRLIGAEQFRGKFFKIYDDSHDVSEEIKANDNGTIHELEIAPTNWPLAPKKQQPRSMLDIDSDERWEDPRGEWMAIPVLHRREERYGRSSEIKSQGAFSPHFIMISRKEAFDEEAIRRKILEKVATFSTWPGFYEDNDLATGQTTGQDSSHGTSDGDSGDTKVVAESVEGEDDLVDVTMREAHGSRGAAPSGDNMILKRFCTQRPPWASSSSFLPPHLQNLFEMYYFRDGQSAADAIPTGWTSAQDNKFYPLSSRMPKPSSPSDADSNSHSSWTNGNTSDNESGDDEIPNRAAIQTRMAEESSEEEDSAHLARFNKASRNGPRSKQKLKVSAGGRQKNLNQKGYSRKGRGKHAKRGNRHQPQNNHPVPDVPPQPTPPDEGPLIRLGEGIIVDWNEEAWERVFGGPPSTGAVMQVESIVDRGLQRRRRARESRRTNGITLDECLDEFEKAEVLSEQDMWYCPRCKEFRRASKKFDLWQTPDILVCHLKRFSSSGWRRDKLDVKVDFPIEGLDLSRRVLKQESGKVEVYDLISVDEHFGGLGGGHYTAKARNFLDGRWYSYNDSSVSVMNDASSAISSAAYLLFYRRRSSTVLGGPRFAAIAERFDSGTDGDMDDTGSGGDSELDGSSPRGSSSVGKKAGAGAGATHRRPGRGSNGQSSRLGDDTDRQPSYERDAPFEDEGVEIMDTIQSGVAQAFNSDWDFAKLETDDATQKSSEGYLSDEAQHDSSSEGRGTGMESTMDLDLNDTADDQALGDVRLTEFPAPSPSPGSAHITPGEIEEDVWRRQDAEYDAVTEIYPDEPTQRKSE